jgi:hypothetical protein
LAIENVFVFLKKLYYKYSSRKINVTAQEKKREKKNYSGRWATSR